MCISITLFINIYYLGGNNDVTTLYDIKNLSITQGTALTLSEVDFVIINYIQVRNNFFSQNKLLIRKNYLYRSIYMIQLMTIGIQK
jgi:hypothetical protein